MFYRDSTIKEIKITVLSYWKGPYYTCFFFFGRRYYKFTDSKFINRASQRCRNIFLNKFVNK